jgi:hypothetical protein
MSVVMRVTVLAKAPYVDESMLCHKQELTYLLAKARMPELKRR